MGLNDTAAEIVRRWVAAWPPDAGGAALAKLLHLLARWRSQLLSNTYVSQHGTTIYGGPFAGMDYVETATEGALIARLIGVYESELHPHFKAIVAGGLDCVIDVGCAEGYYAVGLARIAPEITVYAHDIDPKARAACAELAGRNGVADRVMVGGEFKPEDFEQFAGRRALVLVDTEGAEVDILQPERAPSLAGMHIIVETHDGARPGALALMIERFSPTHDIVRVDQQPKTGALPPWVAELSHLDQLLCVWEWRGGPTPWLVMTPKGRAAS
ncbi:MAG: hypothetical protein E7812_14270 [Phenylobacterium sp.]|nr:MAG: hypothetical protein E7812_14270 [Phenylobacterium sp.]